MPIDFKFADYRYFMDVSVYRLLHEVRTCVEILYYHIFEGFFFLEK